LILWDRLVNFKLIRKKIIFLEVYYDRGNQHDFLYQSKELSKAGDLYQNTKFEFCFANASKPVFFNFFGF